MHVIEREGMILVTTVKQRERNGMKDKIRVTGQWAGGSLLFQFSTLAGQDQFSYNSPPRRSTNDMFAIPNNSLPGTW